MKKLPWGVYPILSAGIIGLMVYAYLISSAFPMSPVQMAVGRSAQTVTYGTGPDTPITEGETGSVGECTASSGLSVAYTSSDTDTMTISGTTITGVAAGTAKVNCNQAGNARWFAATQVQSGDVTIEAAAPSGPELSGTWAWSNANNASSCAQPCSFALNVTAQAGDTVVAFFQTNYFATASCTDNGSTPNVYTTVRNGDYAYCYSVNIANSATTITTDTGSGGAGVQAGAIVISGATALDGSNNAAPGTTAFDSANITPTANGLAVCAVQNRTSVILATTFDSPWEAANTRRTDSPWEAAVTTRTTTSGVAISCGGDTTTNAAADLSVVHFK